MNIRKFFIFLLFFQAALVGPLYAREDDDDSGVKEAGTITVQSRRLDNARNLLSPETGASQYQFTEEDLDNLPQGASTPLNEVLLQAPGVAEDGDGQLHVRGSHGNLQYRINGIMVPEAITGFGQSLDTRFADQISLISGALPAQFGYRTSAVVDIFTKPPKGETEGEISVVGGSRNYGETAAVMSGSEGRFSWTMSGSYLASDWGVSNPSAGFNPQHDQTRQTKGFGFFSWELTDTERLGALVGHNEGSFQIPTRTGLTPQYASNSISTPGPAALNANQKEFNQFEAVSLQSHDHELLNYQVALYHRLSEVHYTPDPNYGDLLYTGVSNDVVRRNEAQGVQEDTALKLNAEQTLRVGFMVQKERFLTDGTAQVFACPNAGCYNGSLVNVTTAPQSVGLSNGDNWGGFWGVYLQDEWKPVKSLTLNAGLRFDQNHTLTDESQVSPRLGAIWELDRDTRLHAGYSAFFTPPASELINMVMVNRFANTSNALNLSSAADVTVKSQRSNYFDLGLSHQAGDHLTLDVDAFYSQDRHEQDEGQFGNALIFSQFNYAQGRTYGVESTASYQDHRWSASLNLAIARAQAKGIETGQYNFTQAELNYVNSHWVYMDHDQRYTVSGTLGYRADWGKLVSDVLFGSGLRSGFANTQTMPDYVVVNAGVVKDLKTQSLGAFEGRFTVVNLFDRSYQLRDGTGIGVGAPQYGIRRTLMLGISRKF
jgi:outer membrane receptor protein involved in Fe transport